LANVTHLTATSGKYCAAAVRREVGNYSSPQPIEAQPRKDTGPRIKTLESQKARLMHLSRMFTWNLIRSPRAYVALKQKDQL